MHDRPVREDTLAPAYGDGPQFARITCPEDDGHLIDGQRLVAVTTTLECDGSCRAARRPGCSCGCGGVNHGQCWTRGYQLDHREIFESELARYRDDQVKIRERREARREAAADRARREFETWVTDHQGEVMWLCDIEPATEPSGFVADMARKVRRSEILSPRMLETVAKIKDERAGQAARDTERARRDAERAARGAGDQDALIPGVYRRAGNVFVVKGNRTYLSWRKACREQKAELPRPHDARLYAKRLVESAPRITEAGTEIPFELVYAPGAIFDLALADRMPLAEAEELATRYAACIVCGHGLKAAKSVRQSIGPVCIKYFGPTRWEVA
jgi:Family of unknown function (DUF6011)